MVSRVESEELGELVSQKHYSKFIGLVEERMMGLYFPKELAV